MGIYCSKENDYEFEVVKLNQIKLPKIYSNNNQNTIKNFNINLPSYIYIIHQN